MNRLPSALLSPYLLLFLAVTFWAGNSTVARGFVGDVPPVALSFWRWVLALVIIGPFGIPALWRSRHVVRRNWPIIVALSVLSVVAFNTLLYLGLQQTTVINASLVAAAMPVLIVALSWILFRTAVGWAQATGIAVSLFGVIVIITRGDLGSFVGLSLNHGDLIILFANLSWALYSVLLRKRPEGLPALAFLTATIIIGIVLIAPIYAWELSSGAAIVWKPTSIMALLYVGVFPSVLSYVFWNRAVHEVGANMAGQFVYLTPALGAGMGMVFLG
ncbi:MAG: DMT family transporter, partial [Rhodospirillales bacterium]|nr:DMT family transporter [Rhodospirillales bacterium]MCW8970915.1 DMT family transporter [Rhodospirillales bacterium]